MTLKVGDRVRGNGHGLPRATLTYEVVGPAKNGPRFAWRFRNLKYGNEFDGNAFEVEKIEDPAPKFKVGDRVRWIKTPATYRILGRSRDLAHKDPNYDWRLVNEETKWQLNVNESELTKIEQSVPFFLRNGDFVVNRKTGRKGEVIRGMVYAVNDPFRPIRKGVPAAAIEEYEDWYPGTYDLIKKDAPW